MGEYTIMGYTTWDVIGVLLILATFLTMVIAYHFERKRWWTEQMKNICTEEDRDEAKKLRKKRNYVIYLRMFVFALASMPLFLTTLSSHLSLDNNILANQIAVLIVQSFRLIEFSVNLYLYNISSIYTKTMQTKLPDPAPPSSGPPAPPSMVTILPQANGQSNA